MPPAYAPTSTPLSPQAPVTCSLVAAMPVPTHGPGGSFAVLARTRVAAPPLDVLQAVRDTARWPRWNSFCPRGVVVEGEGEGEGAGKGRGGMLEVGMGFRMEVFMNGDGLVPGRKKSREQTIVVTKLERLTPERDGRAGFVIAWKGTGWSHWQLHSERVMEFVEAAGDGDGAGTEYACWETFGGVLGSVVKATVGAQLVDRFGDYARDLKDYVERGASG